MPVCECPATCELHPTLDAANAVNDALEALSRAISAADAATVDLDDNTDLGRAWSSMLTNFQVQLETFTDDYGAQLPDPDDGDDNPTTYLVPVEMTIRVDGPNLADYEDNGDPSDPHPFQLARERVMDVVNNLSLPSGMVIDTDQMNWEGEIGWVAVDGTENYC